MAQTVGELAIKLGFDVNDQALRAFDGSIAGLNRNMVATLATSGAVIYGIGRITTAAIDGAQNIRTLSLETGIAEERLRQYAEAAHQADNTVSFDQAANSIANLQQKLITLRNTGQGADAFKMIQAAGVDISSFDAIDIIDQMRSKWQNMAASQAAYLAGTVGLQGFTQFLGMDQNRLDQIGREVAITEEQARRLDDAGKVIEAAQARISTSTTRFVADSIQAISNNVPLAVQTIDRMTDAYHRLMNEISPEADAKVSSFMSSLFSFQGLDKDLSGLLEDINSIFDIIEGKKTMGDQVKGADRSGFFGSLVGGLTPGDPNNFIMRLQRAADSAEKANNTAITNNINITSTAPAAELVDELQRSYVFTDQQRNNGAAF